MPATRSVEDRLAELRHRREQLRAREQALIARVSAQARKDDTRRRILLGSFLLARLEHHPELQSLLRQELPTFLADAKVNADTRRRDMALLAELLTVTPQAASPADSGDRHA